MRLFDGGGGDGWRRPPRRQWGETGPLFVPVRGADEIRTVGADSVIMRADGISDF